ncbi:protein-tyrosine phosphatase family protein [Cedecea davisae]|uniref:protein-tyrosine phosphatase family protein n=1 Tax=Cedecea davisae TaxID=158484 RepID=UPI001D09A07D|nr:protein-tyrosine phosphatase family protein [Cedecea davisae]
MNNLSLNIKAHVFRRVTSAVKLAEENSTDKNIKFAKKLLSARQSRPDTCLRKVVRFNGEGVTRSEKYYLLSTRLGNVTPLQNPSFSESHQRNTLMSRMNVLQNQLLPAKDAHDERYLSPPMSNLRFPPDFSGENSINRFGSIRAKASTAVGQQLNANKISIAGKNVAIACQYPLPDQVESYLKMLVDTRTPIVAVLASQSEIECAKNKMPDYFTQPKSYPCGITTESKLLGKIPLGMGVEAKVYRLEIRGYDKGVAVNVLHVHNWPDKTAISAELTKNLANTINQLTKDGVERYKENGGRSINDPDKLLPVVHCRAGVGRTGQVIAAIAMEKYDKKISLEKIVADMRNSRNGFMVQKEQQFDILIELAEQQGRPLISRKGA